MSHQIQPQFKEREIGLSFLTWGIAQYLHHLKLPTLENAMAPTPELLPGKSMDGGAW